MDYVAELKNPTSVVRHREAVDAMLCMKNRQDYTIKDGVITWNSNGNVPPKELVALAKYNGEDVDIAKCNAERDRQDYEAIAAYRKRMANRTPEEMAEQRAEAHAAHGPGVELVNVLTGESFTT